MIRRGSIFVVVFILVAAGVIGVSQFLQSQPPLEFTVAVSPLAEGWARPAVETFNNSDTLINGTQRIEFKVTVVEDIAVWQDDNRAEWTASGDHPNAWLPASRLSLDYATERRMPFEVAQPSVAQSVMMWGGFASRVNAAGSTLDWDSVVTAAEAGRWGNLDGGESSWGNVNLVFEQPDLSVSGLAFLLSGAAEFNAVAAITEAHITSGDFQDWMLPVVNSVPNFNTLGADPAASMAARGASVGAIGLLPESMWLNNLDGLLKQEDMVLSYPEYQFRFEFPLARWQETSTSTLADSDVEQAVAALGNHLLSNAQQARVVEFGLRPMSGDVPAGAALFEEAATYGASLEPVAGQIIEAPSRTNSQRLLQWFNSAR
jgi:hypothetical protein